MRTMSVVVLLSLVSPLAAQEAKGKRYALLVGAQEYSHPDLPNLRYAQRDVVELGKLLADKGYQVIRLTHEDGMKDPARKPIAANILKHVRELLAKCERADTVLIAFSGHGLQFEKEEDAFFCPMDARPFPDQKATLISLKDVYKELERSFAGVKLLLVDACRNDPMLRRGRGIDADSAPVPPRGVAAMFSCSAGELAFEHEKLQHGVFFYHVLEGLRGKAKNLRGEVTFTSLADYVNTQVAEEVPKLIGGGAKQSPNLKADLSGASPVLLALGKDTTPVGGDPDKREPAVKFMPSTLVLPKYNKADLESLKLGAMCRLFGKSIDDAEAVVLLKTLRTKPVDQTEGPTRHLTWIDHGLSIQIYKGKIAHMLFHSKGQIPTFMGPRSGEYPGELPEGFKFTDTKADVERKLGKPFNTFGTANFTFADYNGKGLTLQVLYNEIERVDRISITPGTLSGE